MKITKYFTVIVHIRNIIKNTQPDVKVWEILV